MKCLLPDDSPACCLDCKYPLRGLTGNRCPECGREFDPGDPNTMYFRRVPGRVTSFLLRPPGWPMHAAAALTAVLLLVSVSVPGTILPLLMLVILSSLVLAGLWVVRYAAALRLVRYYGDPGLKRPGSRRRWLTVPLIAVTTFLLLLVQVPLCVTFWLSQGAMERTARAVMQLPVGAEKEPAHWIGLYPTVKIERIPGGMRFLVQGTGIFDREGFAYSPDGEPTATGDDYYTHFSGPWWLWRESW